MIPHKAGEAVLRGVVRLAGAVFFAALLAFAVFTHAAVVGRELLRLLGLRRDKP